MCDCQITILHIPYGGKLTSLTFASTASEVFDYLLLMFAKRVVAGVERRRGDDDGLAFGIWS